MLYSFLLKKRKVPPLESIIEYLDRFFLICILTDDLVLIRIESIISKCIILQNDDEYFISFYYDETMD